MVAVFREVRRVLRDDGTLWLNLGDCYTSGGRNGHGPVLRGILETYLSGKTCRDKHLHPRCWKRSDAFLRAVLDGYLTGDGHRIANGWKLGFCANDSLAADLRCVAARLGLSLRLKRGTATETRSGKTYPCWRGTLREKAGRKGNDGEVIAIRRSRARRFWSISLRDDPHIFALASGILTGNSNPMPESVTDRPTRAHEQVFLLTKRARYYYDATAVAEPQAEVSIARRGRQRFTPYEPPGQTKNTGLDRAVGNDATRNLRSVWAIPTQAFPGAHFATFPEELPRRCLKAGTSERGCCPECGAPWRRVVEKTDHGFADRTFRSAHRTDTPGMTNGLGATTLAHDVERNTTGWQPTCTCGCEGTRPCLVLDPFLGSGTTLKVAADLGLDGIGIEANPEYVKLAEARIGMRLDL
jgi:hypothetical protein